MTVAPPVLSGLLWLGHQRNGRYSLRGVVHYLDKPIPRGKITAIIAGLIVWITVVSLALAPLDNLVFNCARHGRCGNDVVRHVAG